MTRHPDIFKIPKLQQHNIIVTGGYTFGIIHYKVTPQFYEQQLDEMHIELRLMPLALVNRVPIKITFTNFGREFFTKTKNISI